MAIIKKQDLKKMNEKEMKDKLAELKMELTRGSVTANKARAKTKELKRTIARILTIMKSQKSHKFNPPKGKELKK